MQLIVNGVEHEVESPPLTPLLHVLREEVGVTSPKAGCQQGGCGSCTVLVAGEPRRSCLLAVAACDGAEIMTVEGLGTPQHLAPLQAAFHEQYGSQCGFCTPGMLMATHALLERNSSPSRADIESALAGHVCRCTGYVKIIAAVEAAARGDVSSTQQEPSLADAEPGEPEILVPGSPGMKAVGARLPRYDGIGHVTGRTRFVDDVRVPGMLWAKALRSSVDHAGIRVDVSRAEKIAGVHAVVTHKDVPKNVYGHLEALGIPADEPLLAEDEVRYKGQPIAVVAAEDEEFAAEAVEAIDVEYEERPVALRRPPRSRPGRAQGPPLGRLVSTLRGRDGSPPDPQGQYRRGVRQGRRHRLGRLPTGRDRALPDRTADLRSPCLSRTAA